jgi:hypothetical protein
MAHSSKGRQGFDAVHARHPVQAFERVALRRDEPHSQQQHEDGQGQPAAPAFLHPS